MTCDTCGRETMLVSRVLVDRGYNRADAKPLWNCPECFQRKDAERLGKRSQPMTREAQGGCGAV